MGWKSFIGSPKGMGCPTCDALRERIADMKVQEAELRRERDWYRDRLLLREVGVAVASDPVMVTPTVEPVEPVDMDPVSFEKWVVDDIEAEYREMANRALIDPEYMAFCEDAAKYNPDMFKVLALAVELKDKVN